MDDPYMLFPLSPPYATEEVATTSSTAVRLSRETMRDYLRNRSTHDRVLTLHHAKVAQKSYGNERRYFCPPPCVYLSGGWPNLDPSSTGDLIAYLGVGGSAASQQHLLPLTHDRSYAAAKTVFISDTDKRKYFELHLQLLYANGTTIGRFPSSRIKVISKPSKMKTTEDKHLCVSSGSTVALFNRHRQQTASTTYMHVDDKGYHASGEKWGAFTIHLLSDDEEESEDFYADDGFVHYGATVKLIDTITGISLPRLILRKVDKSAVIVDCTEPVSQLHKVALHLKDTDGMYLCVDDCQIVPRQSTSTADPNREGIRDGAVWTIISTDSTTFRFFESLGPVASPISPVPHASSLLYSGGGPLAGLDLMGTSFTPNLTVWLDDVQLRTIYRCAELLTCVLPDEGEEEAKENVDMCVSIVRDDGVIYATGLTYRLSSQVFA